MRKSITLFLFFVEGDTKMLTIIQGLEEFDQDVWTWRDGVTP
jgi:hypothetical protein